VNLLPEARRQSFEPIPEFISTQDLRRELLQIMDPSGLYQRGKIMRVIASDTWESTFIRSFTPLTENDQQFEAHCRLYHEGIEYTFLNGEQKGMTIGFDGRSYRYVEKQKKYEKSASLSLYLQPLQSYLEWHQTLLRSPDIELLGTKEIENTPYQVLYVTKGSMEALEKHDQYIIYMNTRKGHIDYIEFTMRKLMKSYKGVVHYKNYTMVQGLWMPFWIGIADNILAPEFDHYLVIASLAFDSSD
jgi:hypothetical protein